MNVKQKQRWVAIALILIIIVAVLSGCGNNTDAGSSTNAKPSLGDGRESSKLVKWSDEALKVSFLYPERSKVSTTPGDSSASVQAVGGSPVTVDLHVHASFAVDNAAFKARMEENFSSNAQYKQGYQEYSRKYYEIDGCPAVLLDYKCARGGRESRNIELYAAKGNYEYTLLTIFLAGSNDTKNQATATEIINSFHFMEGTINLAAFEGKDNGKLVKWSSDDLKASFLYPEGAKVSINPSGSENTVAMKGIYIGVGLSIMNTQSPTQCSMEDFKAQMEQSLLANSQYPGFQEYNRKYYMIDGYPAVFRDFKHTENNEERHGLELRTAKGGYYYLFMVYLNADDTKHKAEATKIINSFHLMKGAPDLDAFNGK